eukprot:2747667-Pyramimonas_sp.AAC.1
MSHSAAPVVKGLRLCHAQAALAAALVHLASPALVAPATCHALRHLAPELLIGQDDTVKRAWEPALKPALDRWARYEHIPHLFTRFARDTGIYPLSSRDWLRRQGPRRVGVGAERGGSGRHILPLLTRLAPAAG